jgi:molybdopterin-containing oxidoreductase family molybdopterin binding subunit
MLATVTGNLNINIPSPYVLNKNFPIPAGPYTQIPIMSIYDHVIKQKPFPIKAIWFAGMNYASQMPNQNKILKEVFPNLELIVVSDLFMTATAGYADFVLPVSSTFECMDLQAGLVNWTNYLHLRQKAIEPLYESKPDFRIAAELAIRMGLGEYFDKSDEEYLKEILTSDHPTMEGVSLEKLKEGPMPEKIIDMPQKFNTPTGTIEFYVEKLVPFGQQLPVYLEPVESTITFKAKKYPLSLLSSHSINRVHTTAGNCPSLLNKDPEPTVQINPADANQRNIKDGEIVLVFNDKGRVRIKAKLSEDIMPGVVNIDEGWWPEHFIEGHLNALTHDRINPAQAAIFEPNAAFCDVLVEVEKD